MSVFSTKMKGVKMLIRFLLISPILSAGINGCNFDNPEVRFVGLQDFASLRRCPSVTVRSLTIADSTVPEMQKEDFFKFRNISEFTFTSNHMVIEDDVVGYFTNLIRLDLANNSIASVSANMFVLNKKLTSVSVSYNNISYISPDAFAALTQLRTLHLRNNSINALDSGMFKNNNQLRTLDLSFNHLLLLKKGVFNFSGTPNAHLLLSHNRISEIKNGTFENCSEMAVLYLDHNELLVLGEGTLRGLLKLSVLDVSHNRIESLSAFIFASTPQLKILRVNNNRVATFRPELVLWFFSFNVAVELQPNPLRCICGDLSDAYAKSSALGILPDLTCDDGRSWTVLGSVNCPSMLHLENVNESTAVATGDKRVTTTQESTSPPSTESTTPKDATVISEVTQLSSTTVPPSTVPPNQENASTTLYTIIGLLCGALGVLIVYTIIKTVLIVKNRRREYSVIQNV